MHNLQNNVLWAWAPRVLSYGVRDVWIDDKRKNWVATEGFPVFQNAIVSFHIAKHAQDLLAGAIFFFITIDRGR